MCGIAGIISFHKNNVYQERLQRMNDALMHRGPDGEYSEIFASENLHGGFAHRRLAIIDRSDGGIQPMHYMERYILIYNGEIYNYIELRNILKEKGLPFKSQSDSEVILAAYHHFGKDCLQYFDGMFAFAIWDRQKEKLFCARDRFGEKPFYYHVDLENQVFLFASEMKALWAAGVKREIDEQVLFQYITTGHARIVFQPERTFYKNIFQLTPATFCELGHDSVIPKFEQYWDLDKESGIEISDGAATEKLLELLDLSVKRRLRSDVPAGTSLSGGIDSSIIASLCSSAQNSKFSHTSFSAVFPGFEKDESVFIREIAGSFHLNLNTVSPVADNLVNEIERMMYFQEVPVGSSSAFAQFMVFRLAMENKVTVLLDGQGADEVFAGYQHYTKWYLQGLITRNQFKDASKQAQELKDNGFLPEWNYRNLVAGKLPALTSYLLERRTATKQKHFKDLHPDFIESSYQRHLVSKPFVGKLNDILYFDTMQGPLQELLHYADRNSMAWGREVRLPFLNHDLVQFLFSLPADFKMRNGYTKWILRNAYRDRLPEKIIWRKGKTGFETPQQSWMENTTVQHKISEAKALLVEKKILSQRVLKKPVTPKHAYEADNFDWRYWISGILLNS